MSIMEIEQFSKVDAKNKSVFQKLQQTYEDYVSRWDFPHFHCAEVSTQVALELGLLKIGGTFRIDRLMPENASLLSPYPSTLEQFHFWNTDRKGRIIDLTAAQYNLGLNIPIPSGVVIIDKTSPLFQRYQPDSIQANSNAINIDDFYNPELAYLRFY